MGEAKGEFDEAWQTHPHPQTGHVVGRDCGRVVAIGMGPTESARRGAAARLIAEHNLLLDIPTARLTPSDPVACMLLACLRGADAEAACYADEVIARASAPDGFVPRAELERQLAAARAQLKAFQVVMGKVSIAELKTLKRQLTADLETRRRNAEVPGDA